MEALACSSLLWLILAASLVSAQPPGVPRPCPRERPHAVASPRISEKDRQDGVKAFFRNEAGVPVHVFWCNHHGEEVEMETLLDQEEVTVNTRHSHIFNVRTIKTGRLLYSLEVWPPQLVNAIVKPCIELAQDELGLDTSRWLEFNRLAATSQSSCEGEDSSTWSCLRHVTLEEIEARDPAHFGFTAEEAESIHHEEGSTLDTRHRPQRKFIPNVTDYDGGFLKMHMTDNLKKVLLDLYETRKEHMVKHEVISGNRTNNHKVQMDKINLEHFPHQHRAVVDEMKQVLEWWTQKNLKHTITFGIRIYRRGAMFVNHLDRKESHLASAVLQVGQTTDKDGGWPLEMHHPHTRGLTEVYMQPGEMLLYEGARLEHGRPMRFKGEEFANVFSHFIPIEYRGVKEEWRNPHLMEL